MNAYATYMSKQAGIGPHLQSAWNVLGPSVTSGAARAIATAGGVERGSLAGVRDEARRLVGNVREGAKPPAETDYVTPSLAMAATGAAAYGAGAYLAND